MSELSAVSVSLTLDTSKPESPLIQMMFDDQRYVMLTVKRSIMAAKMVVILESEFGVKDAIVGMAFDYNASVIAGKLVLHSDPTVNGIYVPISALTGHIAGMLNK